MINVNGEDKKVEILDTHLEEDTASLDHYNAYSLIDYNRCGVPLLETVTEPCINSADEAIAFLEALRSIFLYTDTSYARSDRGQIRCDVNVSIMDDNLDENDVLGIKLVSEFDDETLRWYFLSSYDDVYYDRFSKIFEDKYKDLLKIMYKIYELERPITDEIMNEFKYIVKTKLSNKKK